MAERLKRIGTGTILLPNRPGIAQTAAIVGKKEGEGPLHSEFDAVIVPVFRCIKPLCYRNLLYTAVTRARSLLILVGSRETLAEMVENDRRTLRYSGLRGFLQQAAGRQEAGLS